MGHIPKVETTTLNIINFKESLNNYNNSSTFDKEKWIYIPNFYTDYRYILGIKGKNPLIVIGINTSTATPFKLDNTLKSIERISSYNNFDSFIMLNIYAQRATNPCTMDNIFNEFLHKENLKAINYIFKNISSKQLNILAAWGTLIEKKSYLKYCLKEIIRLTEKFDTKWYNLNNLTKNGHPRHPLYQLKNSTLNNFDIKNYKYIQ